MEKVPSDVRIAGLSNPRNKELMSLGYPPGPPKEIAKKLNLKDINTYMKLHEEFGDIYMLPLGDVPLIVTRNPYHIRELLGGTATERFPRPAKVVSTVQLLFQRAQIALDGKEHIDNKRMLSRWLFAEPHNAAMLEPLSEIVQAFLKRIQDVACENYGRIEAYSLSELCAADMSASISMGRTYGAVETGKCIQLEALKICDRIFLSRAMNKNWQQSETPETTALFDFNKKILVDTFTKAFLEIKSGAKVRHNIITHMVEANLANRTAACPMGAIPTEVEAVSNMIGFLAGVGNTARMLTSLIEIMSRHQDIQHKVLVELHQVLGDVDREEAERRATDGLAVPGARNPHLFTYERLMGLNYLKCVMMECLRLYTPSTSVAPRQCTEPSLLGEFTIPAGTNVMANIYGAHRHPKFWDNPEVFDPLRFNEASDGDSVHARSFSQEGFFPFSIGGHSCIGRNVAQEFALLLWSSMISNFRIFKDPDQPLVHFNTLKSDQILGFIEAVNGCHVSIDQRPINAELDRSVNLRIEADFLAWKKNLEKRLHDLKEKQVRDEAAIRAGDRNRPISMKEVEAHTSPDDGIWFVIDGKVYDVTPWLRDHPGGSDILVRSAGRDVTKLFKLTKHSSFAEAEAEKYRIGILVSESKL